MKIMQLSADVSVAGQLSVDDLTVIAADGFKSVINNRPDDEGPDQPKSAVLEAAAARAGLAYAYVPIIPQAISQQDIVDFATACESLDGPLLLFCRSGIRSAHMWNLVNSR
jgi:sulfide:quinone oxidoreductase